MSLAMALGSSVFCRAEGGVLTGPELDEDGDHGEVPGAGRQVDEAQAARGLEGQP